MQNINSNLKALEEIPSNVTNELLNFVDNFIRNPSKDDMESRVKLLEKNHEKLVSEYKSELERNATLIKETDKLRGNLDQSRVEIYNLTRENNELFSKIEQLEKEKQHLKTNDATINFRQERHYNYLVKLNSCKLNCQTDKIQEIATNLIF